MKSIDAVKQFHETFNHPVGDTELKHRQLRIKLIFEELQELSQAMDVKKTFLDLCEEVVSNEYGRYINFTNIKNERELNRVPSLQDGYNIDNVETMDALCDLEYVLSGTTVQMGMYENFDEAFDRVHESNMSKMCRTRKELDDTLQSYKEKGIDVFYEEKNGGYIVKRSIDDKTLKNLYYNAVDLKDLV